MLLRPNETRGGAIKSYECLRLKRSVNEWCPEEDWYESYRPLKLLYITIKFLCILSTFLSTEISIGCKR